MCIRDRFHRTICLTYKPGTAQADADGLLAAFAALPSQVRGLESASVIAPQEGFDACVDLAFATWQAREDCALDDFYQAALSWAKELSASLESRDSSDGGPAPGAGIPLRWHGFLVYFALWAEALVLMVEALRIDVYKRQASNCAAWSSRSRRSACWTWRACAMNCEGR